MSRVFSCALVTCVVAATLQASGQQAAPEAAGPTGSGAMMVQRAPQELLPGTRPDALSTIQGHARGSGKVALGNTHVRLRDGRTGQIVDTQLTNEAGLFTFRRVDPGIYVVEALGPDQASVVASSALLTVNAGEVVSAVVDLPLNASPLGAFLGNSTPSAAAIAAQAAAAGVLSTQVSGTGTCITLQ
jgi:hypothetical protein